MRREIIPRLLHDRAQFIQSHAAVDDFTKSMTRFCVQAVMKYALA